MTNAINPAPAIAIHVVVASSLLIESQQVKGTDGLFVGAAILGEWVGDGVFWTMVVCHVLY